METMTGTALLVARHISKHFGGVQALDDVTLEVRAGDVHCLAGENGCGKSTLIKIISGVEFADAGEIAIGEEVNAMFSATVRFGNSAKSW